jgi:hypothetical protein
VTSDLSMAAFYIDQDVHLVDLRGGRDLGAITD